MLWAQITILVLYSLRLLAILSVQGEKRDTPYNGWDVFHAMVALLLLWLAGGFNRIF